MGMTMRSKNPSDSSGMLSGGSDVFIDVNGLSTMVILFLGHQVSFPSFCENSTNEMCRTALERLRNSLKILNLCGSEIEIQLNCNHCLQASYFLWITHNFCLLWKGF